MKDVEERKIILNDGTEVPYGLLVWSTGVGPSAFIQSLDFPKSPGGRLFFVTQHSCPYFLSTDSCFKFTNWELVYE